jgi:hypothetical protein
VLVHGNFTDRSGSWPEEFRYWEYRTDTLRSLSIFNLSNIEGTVMSSQISLHRPGWSMDVAPVSSALRRGLLALSALARPTHRFVPAFSESYLEYGLMRRELQRL